MDAWDVARLDLEAYLARVGRPELANRSPSRAALDELHEAHVRSFTFDDVDILLDQHAGVGLDAVQDKMVGRGRGGYCFEHATLLAAALERLGYAVTRRLGRVGEPDQAARTHMVVEVAVDGGTVVADPGFGLSLLRPIPLVDGATDDHGGWRYKLSRVEVAPGPGWQLSRWRDDAWQVMHTHDDQRAQPVDVVMGHHFTSTFPSSHFRHGLMVTRHSPAGAEPRHTSLTHETLTVRRPGEPTEHRGLDVEEVAAVLADLAPELTDDEHARVVERVQEVRS